MADNPPKPITPPPAPPHTAQGGKNPDRIRQNWTHSHGQIRTIHTDSTEHHIQNRIGQNNRMTEQNGTEQQNRTEQIAIAIAPDSHGQNIIGQNNRIDRTKHKHIREQYTTAHTT